MQKELGVTWDVDLYGELLKIGGGKERYIDILSCRDSLRLLCNCLKFLVLVAGLDFGVQDDGLLQQSGLAREGAKE